MSDGVDARMRITKLANQLGFALVRFAAVGPTPYAEAMARWLNGGLHGDMRWMAEHREVRSDPRLRMPSARSVVVLGLLHHHRRPPDPGGRTGLVARYAWGRDYHNLMGKRLEKLRRALRMDGVASWGGVDTAPIVERAWAAAAGLGFTGKNAVQFLPGKSSWMFLAVLFVDTPVAPDTPVTKDHCGRCTRCLAACPTQAFRGPRVLDATRCIAYWTIEAPGVAPRPLRPGFGRWVFGCDLCQEVCPHNHDPEDPDEEDLRPRHAWLDLDELLSTPDDALLARFTGTPLRRPKAAGLKRNAALVLGNLGDEGAIDTLEEHGLRHPSAVVRASSLWALRRLGWTGSWADDDPIVLAEAQAHVTPSRPGGRRS